VFEPCTDGPFLEKAWCIVLFFEGFTLRLRIEEDHQTILALIEVDLISTRQLGELSLVA